MPKAREDKQKKHKLSKYIKKGPKKEHTKRENTYVFEGFYEKLQSIDVKHAHSMSQANFQFDRLMEEEDLVAGMGVEAEDQ
jgi:hypothetical protein